MSVLALKLARPIERFHWLAYPAAVLACAFAALAGAFAVRSLLFHDEAMPGVRVLGTDVGGAPAAEVEGSVRALTAQRLAQPVSLRVGGRTLTLRANRLFTLDRPATTVAVLGSARDSWVARTQALVWPETPARDVAPVLVERERARARLSALLAPYGEPPVSARVVMKGLAPSLTPSRDGTRPDLTALLAALELRVAFGGGAVPVRFEPAPAPISDAAAQAAAEESRALVSAPIALSVRGESAGSLSPIQLARTLRFEPHGSQLVVVPDEAKLARVLEPRVGGWKVQAANARFVVDGESVRIEPSRDGVGIDARATMFNVNTAAHSEAGRRAEIALGPVAPDLTTGEARALGIRERVSTFTTEMGPSSSNRIHNVHLMADYIDGTIIRPGQVFSFNDTVGERSPERGFLEGQMIVGSLLLPSIGGGVCQTATTLFNNAYELGLPIVERHNHSFYISHYPLGRDATVSWGGPDFAFRNDLKTALLIKTSYTDDTLTFTFYGTPEGRRVVSSNGPKVNWKAPKTTYALDPAAPAGSVRYVRGSHQSGFDVTLFRTVLENGKVLRKDSFKSDYIPVGDTAVYGPGSSIPGSYFVIPTT